MAATTAGARLTEAHRVAQARLGAQSVRALRSTLLLLSPDALDATIERFLSAAVPIVTGQRATSARLAAGYLEAFKKLELGSDAVLRAVLADMIPAEQVVTSLTVTGPVSIKRAMTRGVSLAKAAETAEVNVSRAGMRLVLGGGRDTITETTRADRQAAGWARATSGRPCAFCAMIAGRGGVFSEQSAAFEAHDGCSCTAEPVFREDAALPAGSDRWARLWAEADATDGDTVKNFQALVAA